MVHMQSIQSVFFFIILFRQMQVQGWAQARIRPTCHHHAHLTYTDVISEGHEEDKILLPIQRAAGLLGEELKAAKLIPESADAVAAFALLLLSIFDQSHGQCPGPTTRDSLTHRLCDAYIEYGDRLTTACTGRTTDGSALHCVCDELVDGIVGVCLSHTSPHARDLPICGNAHTRGCETAWSGLCVTAPAPHRVRLPPKSKRPHEQHNTLPKHADAAAHARAQGATRWGIRAAQRMVEAARRPSPPQQDNVHARREIGPTGQPRSRISFVFLLAQPNTLDMISAGPPAAGDKINICATGPAASAAAAVLFPQPWITHQVRHDGVAALLDAGCTSLATWPSHAESLFMNPCVNGAAAHEFCKAVARDHKAFVVGARIIKDPHTSTLYVPQRERVTMLAAEAEQRHLHAITCEHMRQTSRHHHLPHC